MKFFLSRNTEGGFKLDLEENPDISGIAITVDLLKALGCEEVNGGWQFRMHGYEFRFEQEAEGHWKFFTPGNPHSHSATHLDECFGFAFEDAFQSGKEQKLAEVRDALGIGGEIGKTAKIKTPESDPS